MKIYFVRHGQTESNVLKLAMGHGDSPLTAEGIEMARLTAEQMEDDFDIIYSSDIGRAKKTTEILKEKLNAPVIFDQRLRERNFGSWEGRHLRAENLGLWQQDHDQKYDYRPFGGESVGQVKDRLMDCIRDIHKNHKEQKVLIVTHGGVIRLIHYLLHGVVPEKIHNASVHEFDFPDE